MLSFELVSSIAQMDGMGAVLAEPIFWFGVVTGIAFDEIAKNVYESYVARAAETNADTDTDTDRENTDK